MRNHYLNCIASLPSKVIFCLALFGGHNLGAQLSNGTNVLGTSTSSSYSFVWDNPTPGDHVITVRVTDSHGGVTTSSAVTVTSGISTG